MSHRHARREFLFVAHAPRVGVAALHGAALIHRGFEDDPLGAGARVGAEVFAALDARIAQPERHALLLRLVLRGALELVVERRIHRVALRGTALGQFREWTALYPFFEFSHDDRTGDDSRAVLWPIHKHVLRPGQSETTWWWPAWGTYDSPTEHSSFYAWPVVWESAVTSGRYVHRHMYVVPVWMHRSTESAAGEPVDEEVRAWPFFDWRRRGDGYETVRVPEIFPFFGWEPGETLYADLLSLVRWRGDREGRVAWDGPLGAVRYRRSASGAAKLTLLWWIEIPLGGGS